MLVSIPPTKVWVRRSFLIQKESLETEEGWWCAMRAMPHKALECTVLLGSGALYSGLPLHALLASEDGKPLTLEQSQFWANLCASIGVSEVSLLRRMGALVKLRWDEGYIRPATYRFTVDYDSLGSLADTPSEHKFAHVMKLDSGAFVALPNNRILWRDPALCSEAFPGDYCVNEQEWLIDEGGIRNDGRWDY